MRNLLAHKAFHWSVNALCYFPEEFRLHRSRSIVLFFGNSRVTRAGFPRSKERGPIEAQPVVTVLDFWLILSAFERTRPH